MPILGKYFKTPAERKRYSILYSDWLDTGELLNTVTFQVTPVDANPVVINGIAVQTDGKSVIFYAQAGLDGVSYKAIASATTSGGQVKQDSIQYTVKAS